MCTFSAGLHESESKTSGFATLLCPNHPNKRDFTQVVVLQGVSDVVHIFTSFAFHQLRRLFFSPNFEQEKSKAATSSQVLRNCGVVEGNVVVVVEVELELELESCFDCGDLLGNWWRSGNFVLKMAPEVARTKCSR